MAAQIPAPRRDFIDLFERVLTKGVGFAIEPDIEPSAALQQSASWEFRLSIAAVNVFQLEAGIRWRSLPEIENDAAVAAEPFRARLT